MKKRKLRAKIKRLKRELRGCRLILAEKDPWNKLFTQPFKVGDVVRVTAPIRFSHDA